MVKNKKINTKNNSYKSIVYYRKKNLRIDIKTKHINEYYKESMNALISYTKKHTKNTNEKQWNKYTISNNYLSSKSMGFLANTSFNSLCKSIRREISENKRQA